MTHRKKEDLLELARRSKIESLEHNLRIYHRIREQTTDYVARSYVEGLMKPLVTEYKEFTGQEWIYKPLT